MIVDDSRHQFQSIRLNDLKCLPSFRLRVALAGSRIRFFFRNFMLVVLALPRVALILIVYPGKLIRQWKFHSSTVYVYTHSCQ